MTLPVTQRVSGRGARLEVVRADDGHAAEVAEFIRGVWDPEATADSVLAARAAGANRNWAEPGVPPPTWIALQAGRVLGYVTSLPIRFWVGGQDWPAYWVKGLMVLPEFRNGPIGYLLVKAAGADLPRTGALAVAPPARRLFEALGYRDLGSIPNWVRPLQPQRILECVDQAGLGLSNLPRWATAALRAVRRTGLAAPLGAAAGLVLRASAAGLRFAVGAAAAAPFDPASSTEDLESLWTEARESLPTAVMRNAGYLLDRYAPGPEARYTWLAARAGRRLRGVAILRRPREDGDPRLGGLRVAALADLLYAPGNRQIGLALLGAVERAAQGLGADAILATCSAPAVGALLRRQWYISIPGNVHLLLRDVSGERPPFGAALTDWWLTRGDGLADEVF